MTTVSVWAEKAPDRPAVIYGDAEYVETFAELERNSRRVAHLLRRWGLEPGDCLAALIGNDDVFFDLFWACHRVGLYFTPVNWHLQREEVEYIVENCDAKVFVANARFQEVAEGVPAVVPRLVASAAIGGTRAVGAIGGFRSFEEELAACPEDAPLGEELEGSIMLYSSGTTGRPKGVRRPLARVPAGDPATNIGSLGLAAMFGMKEGDVYLSPAPLYHAAPLAFSSGQHRLGATTVIMRRFDPEHALQLIERHKVRTSQWVPTHFRRMVRLPEEVKQRYDVSSLEVAVHAAAPCPIPLKEQMIDWFGDAILEYYAGTEGGGTMIRASEWLEKKGSVGKHWAGGTVHILDDEGAEVTEANREGRIFFEAPPDPNARFKYHKDAEKTAGTYEGDLFTIGDVGYLDEDGYLFLTDRSSHMIISAGVNIYPQETENHLSMHPKVEDVAVIGVPNEEMGEEVKAVVVPVDGREAGSALEDELIQYCRDGIAHYKCPRSIDFVDELPRTETGKMAKRKLRDRYWGGTARLV